MCPWRLGQSVDSREGERSVDWGGGGAGILCCSGLGLVSSLSWLQTGELENLSFNIISLLCLTVITEKERGKVRDLIVEV